MDPLDVDVDSLRQGADELERAKESVRATFEAFQAMAANYADAFGGDEIGMLLGIAHQACLDAAKECFSTNITELESYAEGLQEMAESFQRTEEAVTASFAKILGSLGG
ncbi:hypothetical protein AB0J86_04960 [Micromonospora sp. NPDC049559]|uniref:WXG100 family type VII secretion target n=1 Tax=Micromonospora sp. NPDC049559 TaxID=3155923 RepID=UPI00341C35B4